MNALTRAIAWFAFSISLVVASVAAFSFGGAIQWHLPVNASATMQDQILIAGPRHMMYLSKTAPEQIVARFGTITYSR